MVLSFFLVRSLDLLDAVKKPAFETVSRGALNGLHSFDLKFRIDLGSASGIQKARRPKMKTVNTASYWTSEIIHQFLRPRSHKVKCKKAQVRD